MLGNEQALMTGVDEGDESASMFHPRQDEKKSSQNEINLLAKVALLEQQQALLEQQLALSQQLQNKTVPIVTPQIPSSRTPLTHSLNNFHLATGGSADEPEPVDEDVFVWLGVEAVEAKVCAGQTSIMNVLPGSENDAQEILSAVDYATGKTYYQTVGAQDTHGSPGNKIDGFVFNAKTDGDAVRGSFKPDGTLDSYPATFEIKDGSQMTALKVQGIDNVTGALTLCGFLTEACCVMCDGSNAMVVRGRRTDVGKIPVLEYCPFKRKDVTGVLLALNKAGINKALGTRKAKRLYHTICDRGFHPGMVLSKVVPCLREGMDTVVATIKMPELGRTSTAQGVKCLVWTNKAEYVVKIAGDPETSAVEAIFDVLPHYVSCRGKVNNLLTKELNVHITKMKELVDETRRGWWIREEQKKKREEDSHALSALWMLCGTEISVAKHLASHVLEGGVEHLAQIAEQGWVHADVRLPNLLRFPQVNNRFLLVDFEFAEPLAKNGLTHRVEKLDMARENAGGAALCALQKFGWMKGFDRVMLYNSMVTAGFFR
jgi:hypothetical protein